MEGKGHSKHTVKFQSINHGPTAAVISDYSDRLIYYPKLIN